jgi:NAD(P)-dependent dehydrogenase (short-subunit alcohol dehydrogenase family)
VNVRPKRHLARRIWQLLRTPRSPDQDHDINLSGAWRTLKAAAPHLAASQGHIVAISSLIAYVHPPLLASYGASKAGVG